MRTIVIRADASQSIGSGHVMRCLTLADALRGRGDEVIFLCRPLEGHIGGYIERRGYSVLWLAGSAGLWDWQEDAEAAIQALNRLGRKVSWLIVDHYGIDERWEAKLKAHVHRIMVIDDLADRKHQCDLLLNQNLLPGGESRYRSLVPAHCKLLLGLPYMLLGPHFYEARRTMMPRSGEISRVLLFFGGSDPTNETVKALNAMEQMGPVSFGATVIIGASNPRRQEILALCSRLDGVELLVQVDNMAKHITRADFALGTGGVAMWERCFLGLPSAVTIAAANQEESVAAAERMEAVWNLGWHEQVRSETYRDILIRALRQPHALKVMGANAASLFSGDTDGKQDCMASDGGVLALQYLE